MRTLKDNPGEQKTLGGLGFVVCRLPRSWCPNACLDLVRQDSLERSGPVPFSAETLLARS